MQSRSLGRSGVSVSALGFGTVSLGVDYGIAAPGAFARPSEQDAFDTLQHAIERGITLFDTAPAYGEAERLVGTALGGDERAIIATKVTVPRDAAGIPLRGSDLERHVEGSLIRSCEALRCRTLEIVQIHNATVDILADGGLLSALEAARGRGLLRHVGASVYSEAEGLAAIRSGRIECLQVAYNLLDQRMARRVFPEAKAAGVGIIIRSAFLKGALTERAAFLPPELAALRAAVERARDALGAEWSDLPRLALRFCLSADAASVVLLGGRNRDEVDAAVAAADEGALPEALLAIAEGLAIDDDALVNPSRWPAW
jgi:aryl-alcohol dehydrogenase-like predicted oxidoreductase